MSKSLEDLGKELTEKEKVLKKTERERTRTIIGAYLDLQLDYPQHFGVSDAAVKHLTKNNKSKKGKK